MGIMSQIEDEHYNEVSKLNIEITRLREALSEITRYRIPEGQIEDDAVEMIEIAEKALKESPDV